MIFRKFKLFVSSSGVVALAPVYDLVTTTVYLKKDVPALSVAGTKKWWPRKTLERFAVSHLSLPVRIVADTIERLAEAVTETRTSLSAYLNEHPEFREIGGRMLAEWNEGVKEMVELRSGI